MTYNFPLFSILYFTQGLLCLGFGVFVFFKNIRSRLNVIFSLFCVGLAVWMIPVSFVNAGLFSYTVSILLCKVIFASVVFLPTLALHFVTEFLGPYTTKTAYRDLKIAYVLTGFFFVLVWRSKNFVTGILSYEWGYFPKGGYVHVIHSMFVVATAIYTVYLLAHGMRQIQTELGKNKKFYETNLLFFSFLFATCACTDFTHSWGVSLFPLGCFFVTLFVISTTYGIFRHELFGVSIVIKKSLVYSVLFSIIISIYFSVVYLASSFIGGLTKVHSVPVIIFVFAVITLLFRPLEQRIEKIMDRIFLRKSRAKIEKENEYLLQEIQKQDRMKAVATLAAGMAHEIKNPLTAIKTFTEHLPEHAADKAFVAKYTKLVSSEVGKIDTIVKQVLDFSKPEKLTIQKLDLRQVLSETLELLGGEFVKNGIEVERQFEALPLVMNGDKKQLKQVFLNLFLNSIQAMPNGGRMSVSGAQMNSQGIQISVSDIGCGIPEKDLPHIFDPFYTTKESGTGLGLSIAHGIIKEHGGNIDVKTGINSGAVFRISFQ